MNGDDQKQTESRNTWLRVWNWLFLCSQTALSTLLVVSWVESSRGNKYIDAANYPISGMIVFVLFVATPPFLVIATPFFWKRLPSACTGFVVGVIGLLNIIAPTF